MLFQSFYKCICCFLLFSCSVVSNSFATPWTIDHQAPLSVGFSRHEYWSGLPFPSPGDLPNPGIEPGSPRLQAEPLPSEPSVKPLKPKIICLFLYLFTVVWASQVALVVKNPPAKAEDLRDVVSSPKSGRSPGEGNGNPLQYSCLGNPLNRGAWQATVHGVAKESRHTERLNHTTTHSK